MRSILESPEASRPTKWRIMGRPTKWSHWLGRLLYLSLALSVPAMIVMGYFHMRFLGVLEPVGLTFVIMGVIDLTRAAGVELYPREVWERTPGFVPGGYSPLFPPPGYGAGRGWLLLALGLITGFLYRLGPWLSEGST